MLKVSVFKDIDNIEELDLVPGTYKYTLSTQRSSQDKFFTEEDEIGFKQESYSLLLTINGKNIPPNFLLLKDSVRFIIELDCPVHQVIDEDDYDDITFSDDETLNSTYQYNDQSSQYEYKEYHEKYYKFNNMHTVSFKFIIDDTYHWEWQLKQNLEEKEITKSEEKADTEEE